MAVIEIIGRNGIAKVFTDLIDEGAREQVQLMMDEDITKDTQVRVMPDVHAGKGSTVGTTIMLSEDRSKWKVSPNVVGVDIGCGIMSVQIAETNINYQKLDRHVHQRVPAGFKIHSKPQRLEETEELLANLSFEMDPDTYQRILNSIGTLGGGNHFMELARDSNGLLWLSVHSGSRNLGVQVAEYHQSLADRRWSKEDRPLIPYLEGELLETYLADMHIAQEYAVLNRRTMLEAVISAMEWTVVDSFDSVHNFIDIEAGIIRKGATPANKGQRLIIPLNMRDGSLIAVGKGSYDWNYSAPHGAGRHLSRTQARKKLKLEDFKKQMEGIYSTSVNKSTLDEAPDAYKPLDNILNNIEDTCQVLYHIKPVYNFKA